MERDQLEVAVAQLPIGRAEDSDYYMRLGLSYELSRQYHQQDWERLVNLAASRMCCLEQVRQSKKLREKVCYAMLVLRDPVLRAHYDHNPKNFESW